MAAETPEHGPLAETPDAYGAYPRLTEQQIERLAPFGKERAVDAGDVLFREGDESYDLFVVLDGLVAMVENAAGDHRVLAVHGPGRFLGELSLLTDQPSFVTAVARTPGSVLDVTAERVRELAADDPALGDLILRAFVLRRTILIELRTGIRIIGSRYSPDTRRLREFAARNRLPHTWIDVEEDRSAAQLLERLGIAPEEAPVVICRGDTVLRNPSNAELAAAIGLRARSRRGDVCDLVVVGAGPAGLAAAVYGASEGLETVVLEAVATGGQAGTSPRIENYLGFPTGITGGELADRATIQARKFGASITIPSEAHVLEHHDGHHTVIADDGTSVLARAVVIASGARYRRLPAANLDRFEGVSVYYAATLVEAELCRGDPIIVVGGGNSGGQASLFLSRTSEAVHLVVRNDDLTENMSRYLVDQIVRNPAITVLFRSEVRELLGEDALEAVVVEDLGKGERTSIPARALFVFIGAVPHTRWLGDQVKVDEDGFVLTGRDLRDVNGAGPEPLLLETSVPGVFAAGDVRSGSTKRVATAVGEGAMAIRLVHEHLDGRRQSATLARREAAPASV